MLAPVRVTSSEFADGRRNEVASPDSEQIELAGAVPHRRNSVSVEQIQDRLRRTAFSCANPLGRVLMYFIAKLSRTFYINNSLTNCKIIGIIMSLLLVNDNV